jgi:hypothetical protein
MREKAVTLTAVPIRLTKTPATGAASFRLGPVAESVDAGAVQGSLSWFEPRPGLQFSHRLRYCFPSHLRKRCPLAIARLRAYIVVTAIVGENIMAILEREFYRSARGPAPDDVDIWRLVFDEANAALAVRHEWRTERHSGVDDFTVAEFLLQPAAAREALLTALFGPAESRQNTEIAGELTP